MRTECQGTGVIIIITNLATAQEKSTVIVQATLLFHALFEKIVPCLPQPKQKVENSQLPTPINTDRLADRLKACDPIDRIILLKGFKQGFNIGLGHYQIVLQT